MSEPRKRKYDPQYLDCGFSEGPNGKPQCVLCMEMLALESMKPSKMKRHLETNHVQCAKKPHEFFERNAEELLRQKSVVLFKNPVDKLTLLASFKVAWRIVKAGKPFTVGEDLIVPCLLDVSDALELGHTVERKLQKIALSDTTRTVRAWIFRVEPSSSLNKWTGSKTRAELSLLQTNKPSKTFANRALT